MKCAHNGINLSDAVVETHRKRVATITSEESILPYRVNVLPYLSQELAIVDKAKASAVVLNDLSGVPKVYLVLAHCFRQANLANNSLSQIVAYQMSKKFLRLNKSFLLWK